MQLALWVGLGGAAGSVARYWLTIRVQAWYGRLDFPFGTLAVNVLGCFLIGLLAVGMDARDILDPRVRALLLIGFLGGFTTYSSFASEALGLGQGGRPGLLLLDVGLHLALGLGAVWLGRLAAEALLG